MCDRCCQKNDTKDKNNNADTYRSISHIKNRPNLKIEKVGDLPKMESVNEVAYRAAQNQAETHPDQHSIIRGPATGQEEDNQQKDNDSNEIKDSKKQGMAFENAKGSAGILDMDNLEETGIKE
jgi:hypothetical protein